MKSANKTNSRKTNKPKNPATKTLKNVLKKN